MPNTIKTAEQDADKPSHRLIERLQAVQVRQRSVIQRFQVENARLLDDLADLRRERDAFQGEAARMRTENVELLNKLNEVLTEYRDLKRKRATVVRFATVAERGAEQNSKEGLRLSSQEPQEKPRKPLQTSNEAQTRLPPKAENIQKHPAKEKQLQPYLYRTVRYPLKSELPL